MRETGSTTYACLPNWWTWVTEGSPVNMAKKDLLDDAGGVVSRAQGAWESEGLPDTGTVGVEQLQKVRAELAR